MGASSGIVMIDAGQNCTRACANKCSTINYNTAVLRHVVWLCLSNADVATVCPCTNTSSSSPCLVPVTVHTSSPHSLAWFFHFPPSSPNHRCISDLLPLNHYGHIHFPPSAVFTSQPFMLLQSPTLFTFSGCSLALKPLGARMSCVAKNAHYKVSETKFDQMEVAVWKESTFLTHRQSICQISSPCLK